MRARFHVGPFVAAILMACLLLTFPTRAQNITTVNATIVDPNGLPYSNASVQAQLIPTGITPTINGQQVASFTRATADVTGTFSMNLASNAVISPGGTQRQFTVNEAPGIAPPAGTGPQQCTVVSVSISGASQSVSSNINAGCPKLSNTPTGSIGGPLAVSNGGCNLTATGSFTVCGNGGSLSYEGQPSLFELSPNTSTAWDFTVAEADAPGNSGSTRQSFLGLASNSSGSFGLNLWLGGLQVSQLFFNATGPTVSLVTTAAGGPAAGVSALGPNVSFLNNIGTVPYTYTWPNVVPVAGQVLSTPGGTTETMTWNTIGVQCGTVAANGACTNTLTTAEHCVSGIATLSAGASTITGISPAFTSSSSFTVTTNDITTKANASDGIPASASSITFSGTGTDNIAFIACGG